MAWEYSNGRGNVIGEGLYTSMCLQCELTQKLSPALLQIHLLGLIKGNRYLENLIRERSRMMSLIFGPFSGATQRFVTCFKQCLFFKPKDSHPLAVTYSLSIFLS